MQRENQSIVEVEKLTKKFGRFIAVDHVSFDIKKGEIFGLLGPNGAGKSTIMRMLCTLTRPTEGRAEIAGFDISKAPSGVREHIGLVTEKLILYDRLTAGENLRLFGKLSHVPDGIIRERTDRLLKLVQMEEWRNHLAGTFSTGMKQRINIARALLTSPDVLFLDEPTLGLDPQTTSSLREFIQKLSGEGITILLTTHIMVEADMLCHRVGIIDLGKIVALDTPANLKRIMASDRTGVLNLEISNLNETMISEIEAVGGVVSIGQKDEHRLSVHTSGESCIDNVIDVIRANSGRIQSVTTVEPTLEDVFLHLTGKEMRDEATEKIPSRGRRHFGARPRVR